jgi:hypothetical protein
MLISPSGQVDVAFQEAKKAYVDVLKRDPQKVKFLQDQTKLQDIVSIVTSLRDNYSRKQQDSKAKRWSLALSSRINYYGCIMDVLVQHHPEYVSLAWGTMKLLFVVGQYLRPFPVLHTAKFHAWHTKS